MKTLKRAREILDIEIEQLQKARDGMDRGFSRAVKLILRCIDLGGKIVVTGMGKNFHVGQKISATLASTGSTSVAIHPSQALHGDIGIFGRNDVLLALSYSGESEDVIALLPAIKRQGGKIVALTGTAKSSLARLSDEIILASVTREACPFNMAPTASTTAAMAIGDALAVVLLEARGFKKEDFAKLHPGGTIGKTLLLRVSDIMRGTDRLATVRECATIQEAVLAMTRARSGSVGVVDGRRRLKGIFTDGDLRRLISMQGGIPDRPIKTVMTSCPVTVRPEDLAVDVLKQYEEHNIDDLLVVDLNNRVVGIVDIQDLPKFKIL
jgi:arabinose-5-phosphate isomerase